MELEQQVERLLTTMEHLTREFYEFRNRINILLAKEEVRSANEESRIRCLEAESEAMSKRIATVEMDVDRLKTVNKALIWLVGVIGLAVIGAVVDRVLH